MEKTEQEVTEIRNEMIKDMEWHIEYHKQKMEIYKVKLQILKL